MGERHAREEARGRQASTSLSSCSHPWRRWATPPVHVGSRRLRGFLTKTVPSNSMRCSEYRFRVRSAERQNYETLAQSCGMEGQRSHKPGTGGVDETETVQFPCTEESDSISAEQRFGDLQEHFQHSSSSFPTTQRPLADPRSVACKRSFRKRTLWHDP